MVLTYYAQLDANRIVVSVTQAAGEIDAPHMIPLESYDPSLLGKFHNADAGRFEDAPADPNYVPSVVSSRQGQLALLEAGHLDQAELMIDAIEGDTERRRARIEWGAAMWERSSPFMQDMWSQLGGTPDQLDELFRHAATL